MTEAHHWVYLPNEVRVPKVIEKKIGDKKKKYKRYYYANWSTDKDKEWSTHKWYANCYDEPG